MTISPPAKVMTPSPKPLAVLASGVDSLVLSLDIMWQDDAFFQYLETIKALAVETGNDAVAILRDPDGDELCKFLVKPHGAKGYEWILTNDDYTLKIGSWLEPGPKPGVIAECRSELLWREGAVAAVHNLLALLVSQHAEIRTKKPSRIDLCLDIVLSPNTWSQSLLGKRVTRAAKAAPYFHNQTLTGIAIGGGAISARLYDKPLEITQKSHKFWMLGIWRLGAFPEHGRIIRVEFQLRREVIKELGFDDVFLLFDNIDHVWSYCTRNWLKFQNMPGKHHTQRKNYPWWEAVQNGFMGIQDAEPLIRCKAVSFKKKQLFNNAYGCMTSFAALDAEENFASTTSTPTIDETFDLLRSHAEQSGKSDFSHEIAVLEKAARYGRAAQKMHRIEAERKAKGFPSNLPIGYDKKW